MEMQRRWSEDELLRVCGSRRFAQEMAAASPFSSLDHAIECARYIWLNHVDVNGWLEAFAAHPPIGTTTSSASQWSKEEQSTALATATSSTSQELVEWNAKYRERFGFVFMICASGRGSTEVLAEIKRRYTNRPIIELEIAAQEEMKITALRLAKLFFSSGKDPVGHSNKVADRVGVIAAHLRAAPKPPATASKTTEITSSSRQTRPPITTHVLDVARGLPASGMEVHLEMWNNAVNRPSFTSRDATDWMLVGSSVTGADGRSGALMDIVDHVASGVYRISFDTGKYAPSGFFPYVSIIFEIREDQRAEHFHVPLLHSPYSFTTYRGS